MIETLQDPFTLCIQRNPNDTFTIAGLVNIDDMKENATVSLFVQDGFNELKHIAEIAVDEFRYFEMQEITIVERDYEKTAFYIGLTDSGKAEKIEL